jgi:LysR family glycine cleavage system transcriptional activator
MARPLPPLNALRAFEATARHLSFARAAEELSVTPAALSHQVKGLEDYLGRKLFERRTRSIALTDAGAALYPGLHAAFLQIRQSVDLLDRDTPDRVLVVSAPPGFTAKWLAPRLYRFAMKHPDIDVRISASRETANFTTDGVDVAIRNARGTPPALWSQKIIDIRMVPVVSPRLLARVGGLETPRDLSRLPVIHDDMLGRLPGMPTWIDWLKQEGVGDVDLGRGLRFNSPDHALDAAVEGAGVLFAQRELAHDDLRSGRLIAPFPRELETGRAFYVVCPIGRESMPKIKAFADWIAEEVRRMDEQCAAGDTAAQPLPQAMAPPAAAT